jgi:prolyl-tRNA synthetase
MKDSYSLDTDWDGLDRQYDAHYRAYFNIFHRCALPVIAVRSDVGTIGGKMAHEFMYLTPAGEDTLLICSGCGFSSNQQVASFRKKIPIQEEPLPLEKVATPGCKNIDDLALFLDIPSSKTAKAVFMLATISEGNNIENRFVFTLVRGDMEVNETKLSNAIKARTLRPATEDEIRAVGAVPGYASPVGLKDILVIVDDAIPLSTNLVSGANEEGYHLKNVNYGRDYKADIVLDIAAAREGDPCPLCTNSLKAVRGVEVGKIFKLGTCYSDAMGCNYLDAEGGTHPVVMGSYGINSNRLLACIAEEHHDEHGLKWPISVAPYQVHLVVLSGKGITEVLDMAEALYAQIQEMGIEVLYDDRPESPGVKFNDADLIGIPIRLTVSERAMKEGGVEFKRRDLIDKENIPVDQVVDRIKNEVVALQAEII